MTQEQSTTTKPKIESKRNAENHPLCTVSASGTGLQKNNVLGIYFHRTQADFIHTGVTVFGKNGANIPNTTHGHEKINPPNPPSMRKEGEPLSKDNLTRLQDMIDFAEKQVVLDYTDCKLHKSSKISATQAVVDKYVKEGPHPDFGKGKDADKYQGMCLVYVKVALNRKDYINGVPGTGDAKNSGGDWKQYDFADVSADRPKVEITYEKVRTIKKKGTPPEIATEPLHHTQPDLIQTLPGDVIVYEQVDPVDAAAPGHVDIRTYHGFMSDAACPRPMTALGTGSKNRYRVTGVYRKISDTLAMVRVQAFLRIIREHVAGETTLKDKDRSYHLLQNDKNSKDPFAALNPDTALGMHPSDLKKNKPAGAYQIIYSEWKKTIDATGWPKTFTPDMQDRIAMYLLQACPTKDTPHPRRSALGYIMENKLDEAVNLIKQEKELAHWSGDFAKFNSYVNEATKK
jgi:muramidase (phage lysozyme)